MDNEVVLNIVSDLHMHPDVHTCSYLYLSQTIVQHHFQIVSMYSTLNVQTDEQVPILWPTDKLTEH